MLDDAPERAHLFQELTGYSVDRTPHVAAALKGKEYQDRAVWLLDHDMCKGENPSICPMTNSPRCTCLDGCIFIRRVVAKAVAWPKVVIVHSANVARRVEMRRLLKEAGCPRHYVFPVEMWESLAPSLKGILAEVA